MSDKKGTGDELNKDRSMGMTLFLGLQVLGKGQSKLETHSDSTRRLTRYQVLTIPTFSPSNSNSRRPWEKGSEICSSLKGMEQAKRQTLRAISFNDKKDLPSILMMVFKMEVVNKLLHTYMYGLEIERLVF